MGPQDLLIPGIFNPARTVDLVNPDPMGSDMDTAASELAEVHIAC